MQSPEPPASSDGLVEHDRPAIFRRPGGNTDGQLPGNDTSPSSADSSPTIIRNSVVLPAPVGPTRPTFVAGIELEGGVDEEDLPPVCC